MSSEAFVGRRAELDAIVDALAAAADGRSGVVWISGPAGAGKSTLVRQVITGLEPGVSVIRVQGDEWATDVDGVVLESLGITPDRSSFANGLAVLERLTAAGSPTVLVVEDLHWADATSRQGLLVAARRLDADAVAMIVTSRDEPVIVDGWADLVLDESRVRRVPVGALSVSDIVALGARSGLQLSSDQARRLHVHTRGHALYVRTLLDELTPELVSDPRAELPVPRTLAAATTSRLDALDASSRSLAAALAVMNQPTTLPVVAHVADVESPGVALQPLLASHLVHQRTVGRQLVLEYQHPLYQRAVYASIDFLQRQVLHRRAADVLAPTAALGHRAAAADGLDDDLADELTAAAERDARAGRRSSAAKQLIWASSLRRGRAAADSDIVRAAELMLVDWRTAEAAALREQIDETDASPRRSLVLGMLAWQLGDAAVAEAELTAARREGDDDVAAAAAALLSRLHLYLGRSEEAVECGRQVVALRPADHAVEVDGWTAIVAGIGMRDGPVRAAHVLAERLPEERDDIAADDVELLMLRGLLGFSASRVSAPAADLRATVSMTGGDASLRSHLHLAQILYRSGQWDEAVAYGRVALALATDGQDRVWMRPQVEATLGQLFAAQGEWTAAEAHIATAQRLTRQVMTSEAVLTTRIGTAALAFARYRPEAVIEQLQTLSDLEATCESNALAPVDWWPMLVIALLDVDDVAGAEREQERLVAAGIRRDMDLSSFVAGAAGRVAHARGDLARANEQFGRALSLAGEDSPALDRALLHQSFGEALRTAGDRKQSVIHLRRAHDMLAELGAAPFRTRAETTLHESGLRPRRSRDQRRFELTDRERDVAALVATGMTNKEVAASLFVSSKAVEYHLGNIFAKLGLSSRRELRAHAHALQTS